MSFVIPAGILAMEDGLPKFNAILVQAVHQGLLRPEETAPYRRIYDRGRKRPYWTRHVLDLISLLEERAKKKEDPHALPVCAVR